MLFLTPLTSIVVKVFKKEHGKYIEITNKNKVNRCETYTRVSLWIGTKHWITTCLMFWIKLCVSYQKLYSLIVNPFIIHISQGFPLLIISPAPKTITSYQGCIVGVLPLRLGPKNCFWETVIRKMWNMCQFAGAEVKSSQGCCKLLGLELLITTEALNSVELN